MARRGRPPKYDEQDKAKLVEEFERYIETEDVPIVAEFAASHGLWKSYFYDNAEFANLVKRAASKKESALERGALKGTLNPTMAVFSLKQLGWRDKPDGDADLKTLVKLLSSGAGFTPEQIEAILKAGGSE
ncbi:hypothetical protein [Cohnella zeiphila]|uniref:Uncharacterized protein n=1 Tax=Cohnella zeiphila TaxID=2761120 RepID=A0A7X0SN14_9BACL|nr:hypothetical protein [Cohnella zeiphila]MBB6731894.1 hypothetical protein [Cohnella zeiphila]